MIGPRRAISRAFMDARDKFHSAKTPETATVYADLALATYSNDQPVLVSIAAELENAGFADEAKRVLV
jgi:hypothetical protein